MITLDQVNAFLWGKHRLDLLPVDGLPAERLIGIYGAAPTCYLSSLARDPGFQLKDLDHALYADRRLARLRCMRNTLFLLPTRWIPLAYQATREANQSAFRNLVEKMDVGFAAYRETAEQIEALLEGRRLTASEMKKSLPDLRPPIPAAFNFIISLLCAEGRLVRAEVRGSWKSNLFKYARLTDWLPDLSLEDVSAEEAQIGLARLYFQAYAPAKGDDFHWWSGLSAAQVEVAMAKLKDELVPVTIQDAPDGYLVPEGELSALLATPTDPRPGTALLPVWDAYLMAYRHRERLVSPRWYDHVYDGGGNATSTVLSQGRVAGVWDLEIDLDTISLKVSFFEDREKVFWPALQRQAERLAEAIGMREVRLLYCANPRKLGQGPKSRFKSPLKDCVTEPPQK